MTVFDVLSYGHGVFFVTLQTLLMFGIFLEWRRDKSTTGGQSTESGQAGQPAQSGQSTCPPSGQAKPAGGGHISLIIPIHNEGRRMEGLLRSLLTQDYPAEIIFVDDRSDDESPAMLAQFARQAAERGMANCRIITLTENPGPNRKQYALSAGIAEARGDYLLFTDGDCEAPPGWIRAMIRRMDDAKVGVVIGPVFKKKQGRGFFFLYQCYDHAIRYNYMAGAIGLGAAGGGFGNNLIVSRAALDSVGGYDAVPPSPTEDAALISLIRSRGVYRVRAIALPDAAVETGAEGTWRSLINQTLRWNNGGLFGPELMTRLNYNLLMLLISTSILVIPLLPFFPGLWPMPTGIFIVMIENTIASFGLFRKKLPPGGPLNLGYALTLLFTPLYFTLIIIMSYCGIKATWKNKQVAR